MVVKHSLVALDYVIIVAMLVISTIIGWKFRMSRTKCNANEYLMAGKDMVLLPVILSSTVSLVSGLSLIATPSEVYRYEFQFTFSALGVIFGILLAANVSIPVYFQCNVNTIYEYLELRYGKLLKYIVSILFIIQSTIFMGIALLPPVMALSSVTDLSIELSIVVCGSVCTVYCLLGGLRGVLWTDVFQCMMMVIFLVTVYTAGIADGKGIKNIIETGVKGGKMDVDFRFSMSKRFTFWNTFLSGFFHGFSAYGSSQIEVQRSLSLKNLKRAKRALYITMFSVAAFYTICAFLGVVLYAIYSSCDPVFNKEQTGVLKYEQLVPYYLVNRFAAYPGLSGLCIAGIFSGSLSTISSALNSIATVTIIDFVKPNCKFEDSKLLLIAKGLTVVYGTICIVVSFVFMNVSSMTLVANMLFSMLETPMAAVFAAGMLSRRVTQKSALIGLIVGFAVNNWIGYGSMFNRPLDPPVNLGTNCSITPVESTLMPIMLNNSTCLSSNSCSAHLSEPISEPFLLYKISFLWIRAIGFVVSLTTMLIVTLITSICAKDVISSNSVCLSPVTRFWTSKDPLKAPEIQMTTSPK